MSKIFPKCPKCGQREWSVKRREETLSVASTHDIDGPFQNEEIIDSDLISLRFFCASGECPVEDEAPDSLRDRLETAYYAAINRT
jgi:hypothetical protein